MTYPAHQFAVRNAFVEDVVSTTATDTAVDCLGYDYATVILTTGTLTGALTAWDIHFTAASNTSVAAANQIFGASGTTGNSRLPQAGDDDATFVYHINLSSVLATSGSALAAGARYLQFVATAGVTANELACTVLLSNAAQVPTSATEVTGDSTNVVTYIN